MLIRMETIRNSNEVLVIDELGKYIGALENEDVFYNCINTDLEPFEEDGYVFYHTDKNELNQLILK